MTFTGDLGTIYPYLTLPKFEFTKVNVCLNNIAIVQLILDKNFIIVKQLSFIKNFFNLILSEIYSANVWIFNGYTKYMFGVIVFRTVCEYISAQGHLERMDW